MEAAAPSVLSKSEEVGGRGERAFYGSNKELLLPFISLPLTSSSLLDSAGLRRVNDPASRHAPLYSPGALNPASSSWSHT